MVQGSVASGKDGWVEAIGRRCACTEIGNLEFVYINVLGCGEWGGLVSFGFAGIVVGSLAVDFYGTENGRHLLNGAQELGNGLLDKGQGDVLVGVVAVDGAFEIVARSGGAKDDGARIYFLSVLQLLDGFGGFPHTNKEDSGGQGVEGAGMAYFEFLKVVGAADGRFNLVDGLEGSPLVGFVDNDHMAVEELL